MAIGVNERNREEIIYAEIDLKQIAASKRMFDVAGHYARPDVFKFMVNREPNPVMQVTDPEVMIEAKQTLKSDDHWHQTNYNTNL